MNRISAPEFLSKIREHESWSLWVNPAIEEIELIIPASGDTEEVFHGPDPLTTNTEKYRMFLEAVRRSMSLTPLTPDQNERAFALSHYVSRPVFCDAVINERYRPVVVNSRIGILWWLRLTPWAGNLCIYVGDEAQYMSIGEYLWKFAGGK